MGMPKHSKFYGKSLLEEKRAVVTGAGSGIGRQIAYTLAEQGAQVVILDYKKDLAEEASQFINKEFGKNKTLPIAGDVGDESKLKKIFW